MLIAIEGVDGAGKRTLTDALSGEFRAAGMSVALMVNSAISGILLW